MKTSPKPVPPGSPEQGNSGNSVLLTRGSNVVRPAEAASFRPQRVPGAGAIRARELPVFTRALAAMLSAGLPVIQSLAATEEQAESPAFRRLLGRARLAVQYGNSLSSALSLFPDVFDEMYVNMLRTGEASGRMAETLERQATHLESAAELRHKVQSALIYPVAVAAIATLLASGILVWIVPAFEQIYADLGGALPLPTLLLVAASRGMRQHALVVIAIVMALVLAVKWGRRTRWGGYAWSRLTLSLPVFGPLLLKLSLARFAEALSQMLHNGIPILRALDLAARVVGNRVIETTIQQARAAVERGDTFSAALRASGRYPSLLIQFVATGEKTGRIDGMIERAGRFYRDEVAVTLRGITSLVEPMLIMFLGTVIGGMVVCLFIPIFKLHELVKM